LLVKFVLILVLLRFVELTTSNNGGKFKFTLQLLLLSSSSN